jgi:hypothetical protein
LKRIVWSFLVFWLIWGLIWLALSHWRDDQGALVLWYAEPSFSYLVPVKMPEALATAQTPQAKALMIVALLREHVPLGLGSPLVGVEGIENVASAGGTGGFRLVLKPGIGSAAERLAVGALVRTLSGVFTDTKDWQVSLGSPQAQRFESQHLDLSKPLRAADFENQVDTRHLGITARLWLRVTGSAYLVPCRVALSGQSDTPGRDALAMLATVSAWAPESLDTPLPGGMRVTWSGMASGVVTLTVDTESTVSREGQTVALVALVNSLLGIPGIEAVDFRFESTPPPDGLPFDCRVPIRRPLDSADGYILSGGTKAW